MVRTALSRYLWWVAARFGLCLGGIDDAELQRLRFRRLRLMTPLVVGALILAMLAGGLTAGQGGMSHAVRGLAKTLQVGSYLVAGALGMVVLGILLYARIIVRRALRDRTTDPVACKVTLHGLIRARRGGWPVRVRRDDGRWLWLTASPEVLAPIERRLANEGRKRPYRFTVAVVHHLRSRVIKEIAGLKVEAIERALARADLPLPERA